MNCLNATYQLDTPTKLTPLNLQALTHVWWMPQDEFVCPNLNFTGSLIWKGLQVMPVNHQSIYTSCLCDSCNSLTPIRGSQQTCQSWHWLVSALVHHPWLAMNLDCECSVQMHDLAEVVETAASGLKQTENQNLYCALQHWVQKTFRMRHEWWAFLWDQA